MPDEAHYEAARELIQGLLLEAGRLMENESAELALVLPIDLATIIVRVDQAHQIATDIGALTTAARALARNIGDQPSAP